MACLTRPVASYITTRTKQSSRPGHVLKSGPNYAPVSGWRPNELARQTASEAVALLLEKAIYFKKSEDVHYDGA